MWVPQFPWESQQMYIPDYTAYPAPMVHYMTVPMGDMSVFNDGTLPVNAQGLWDRVG